MGLRLDLNDFIASQAEVGDHFAGCGVFVFPAGEVERWTRRWTRQ